MKTFSNKYGIHITRLGKAGSMALLSKDNYITTDKAYIIYLKDSFKKEFKIISEKEEIEFYKWFIITQKNLILFFKTSSDNGSWNKGLFFDKAHIKIPTKKEVSDMGNKYDKLIEMKKDISEFEL